MCVTVRALLQRGNCATAKLSKSISAPERRECPH
jgi:hypothetical protein